MCPFMYNKIETETVKTELPKKNKHYASVITVTLVDKQLRLEKLIKNVAYTILYTRFVQSYHRA